MATILQTTFSNTYSWMKRFFLFWLIFHWSLFLMVKLTIFSSDNSLATNRQQAIIWSKADPVHSQFTDAYMRERSYTLWIKHNLLSTPPVPILHINMTSTHAYHWPIWCTGTKRNQAMAQWWTIMKVWLETHFFTIKEILPVCFSDIFM